MLNSYTETTLNLNPDRCINCKHCLQVCPHAVFAEGKDHVDLARPASCMECGACALNCPVQAITVQSGVGCAWAMIRAALRGKDMDSGECRLRGGRGILLRVRQRGIFLLRGKMTEKTRVLFICTANAARSQMAEGYLRARYGDRFEAFSAGTRQSNVSARAITVMQEIGIDISGHRSKTLDEVSGMHFDLAVTLCDRARQVCPVVPAAKRTIHRGFPDPHLTPGTDDEILEGYRRVRDEITSWIDASFGTNLPQ